jgi:hypothetical protein
MKNASMEIIHYAPERDIEETVSFITFKRAFPYLDSTETRTGNLHASRGFKFYTDFLLTGTEFFRVCHDQPVLILPAITFQQPMEGNENEL